MGFSVSSKRHPARVQGMATPADPILAATTVAAAEQEAAGEKDASSSSSSVRFSAEAKLGPGHFFVSDGLAHSLPEAAKEAVGQDLHVTALVGAQRLQVRDDV